jgi:hypothetical protein
MDKLFDKKIPVGEIIYQKTNFNDTFINRINYKDPYIKFVNKV